MPNELILMPKGAVNEMTKVPCLLDHVKSFALLHRTVATATVLGEDDSIGGESLVLSMDRCRDSTLHMNDLLWVELCDCWSH